MKQHFIRAALFAVIVQASPSASAAPEVYAPNRLYVSGVMYDEPRRENYAPQERIGYPVEVWYFEDMCIVSRTTPYLLQGSSQPTRLVYAYWYGQSAPDGDFWFQQWVSQGANPVDVYLEHHLPRDAQAMNPLWHLLHYRVCNGKNLESPVAAKDQLATGTVVRLHDPSSKESYVEVSYNIDYLVQDDRILSRTYTMDMKYAKPSADQQDHVMLLEQMVVREFDLKFPDVPRKIQTKYDHPVLYNDRTFEADRIDNILPEVTPQDVLSHLTPGLQRIHKQVLRGSDINSIDINGLELLNLEDDSPVRFEALGKDKFLVIYTWASWAPVDLWESMPANRQPYGLVDRLKALYEKFRESPDVEFIGISLDVDRDAAKAFAEKHKMPWRSYLAPDAIRAGVVARFTSGELPNVTLIEPDAEEKGAASTEYVLGSRYDSAGSSTPLESIIEEKHAASRAGGFAKFLLGESVIGVLENFETVEVLQLTGDHMGELMMGAYASLPPPPPVQVGEFPVPPVFTTRQAPNTEDFPTSSGVLVEKYPIAKRAKVRGLHSAREVVKLLIDDEMVSGRGGEEAFPAPKCAIVFKRGDDVLSLVYDGMVEVYLNDKRVAWLMLTEQGDEKFQELYRWLAKDAGVIPLSQSHRQ